jgi:Amt family ammonium transporter
VNLPLRNLLHYLLGLPILVGLAVFILAFVESSENTLTEDSYAASSSQAWEEIFAALPAAMPGEYPFEADDAEVPETEDDLDDSEKSAYARSNAFLVSCSLLVLLGCLGLGLIGAASTIGEPIWNPVLRAGAMISAGLIAFLLWGFHLAFPGDSFGIFPRPYFGLPGQIDSVEYGLNGITEWADLLYIATYAAFFGCLLLTFCHRRQTAASAFLVALPVATLFFPIVVSWHWGGGWIDAMGKSYDFAGAALVHWQVGATALVVGGLATLFRSHGRKAGVFEHSEEPTPAQIAWLVPGAIGYWLALIGLNVGSTLDAAPAITAPVLQGTLIASGTAGILAIGWSFLDSKRGLLEYLCLGAIAGAVAVSGPGDSLSLTQALGFGVIAGLLVPALILAMGRVGWHDPLAVGAVHGIAGLISVLGTPLASLGDDYTATFGGQLLLAVCVPILGVITGAFVTLVCGAAGFLLTDRNKDASPPPIPGSSGTSAT